MANQRQQFVINDLSSNDHRVLWLHDNKWVPFKSLMFEKIGGDSQSWLQKPFISQFCLSCIWVRSYSQESQVIAILVRESWLAMTYSSTNKWSGRSALGKQTTIHVHRLTCFRKQVGQEPWLDEEPAARWENRFTSKGKTYWKGTYSFDQTNSHLKPSGLYISLIITLYILVFIILLVVIIVNLNRLLLKQKQLRGLQLIRLRF